MGFYSEIFKETRTAYELLLPWLINRYLYKNFKIGCRKKKTRKTLKYYVQTVGDLTVLALIGKILSKKYPSNKTRLLIERFERPENHREFFGKFDKIVKLVLRELITYARERKKESKARGEETWDPRELHRTYNDMLKRRGTRKIIQKCVKILPKL